MKWYDREYVDKYYGPLVAGGVLTRRRALLIERRRSRAHQVPRPPLIALAAVVVASSLLTLAGLDRQAFALFGIVIVPTVLFLGLHARSDARPSLRDALADGRCLHCAYPCGEFAVGHSGLIKCPECGLHTAFPPGQKASPEPAPP